MARKLYAFKVAVLTLAVLGCLYSLSSNIYPDDTNDNVNIQYEVLENDYEEWTPTLAPRPPRVKKNQTVKTAGGGSMFLTRQNKNPSNESVGPIIMFPSIYYKYSKYFDQNTALLQFRARNTLSVQQNWFCKSRNEAGEEMVSSTFPESAYLINKQCFFHTFYAKCPTVTNPTFLAFIPVAGAVPVELPITYPVQEKLPVVTCGSPVFFGERWQQAVLAIEFLSFYGVSRQVYYFISAQEGYYQLLKAYEELRMIDLALWSVADIGELRSKKHLYMRDQIGAMNDCYQRYREAADFIIIHDMDDLIFIPGGRDYHKTFSDYWATRPNTAFVHYYSYVARLTAAARFDRFDLGKVIDTTDIGAVKTLGKSVLNTSLIESTWIHFPHFFDDDLSPLGIKLKEGILIHTRKWNIENENSYNSLIFPFGYKNPSFPRIDKIISKNQMDTILSNFDLRMSVFQTNPLIANLESSLHYYITFDKCTKNMGDGRFPVKGCRTAYACRVPKVRGFRCVQTSQKFNKLAVDNFTAVYVPRTAPTLELQENGCTV